LPEKVRAAALESILEPIAGNPQRLGKPIPGGFEGLRSTRRGDCPTLPQVLEHEQVSSSTAFSTAGLCAEAGDLGSPEW